MNTLMFGGICGLISFILFTISSLMYCRNKHIVIKLCNLIGMYVRISAFVLFSYGLRCFMVTHNMLLGILSFILAIVLMWISTKERFYIIVANMAKLILFK